MVKKATKAAGQTKISQLDIPQWPLEAALRIASGIWENYAGKGAAPHNIAMALGVSPTSSAWRSLCGASIAYGLTDGGYNANMISLSDLGRRIVAPTSEGEDARAKQEAALRPRIAGEFYRQYDRAKFPRDDIGANVLVEKGIPKDRAGNLMKLIKENGYFVGFIKDTKTGPFVSIDVEVGGVQSERKRRPEFEVIDGGLEDEDAESLARDSLGPNQLSPKPDSGGQLAAKADENQKRVFITHGKNKDILQQIKEVVELGGFEPIISMQRETAARPIPDKVLDDMRQCGAAVIHVGSEGILTDADGAEHPQINPNVLIEIGAAMALYRGRFILVVEEGVKLPSNLQGLYESRYRGNAIEFQAGMRILKALRGLKNEAV